ncbi:hypothetical protein DL770_009484 [Monosporascus sp. CRB-9-2]|nr:hypothetical protein DL770_009484 [Monosporascus sp. CRB-9-2]
MPNPTQTLLLPLLLSSIAAAASNGSSAEAPSRSEPRANGTMAYARSAYHGGISRRASGSLTRQAARRSRGATSRGRTTTTPDAATSTAGPFAINLTNFTNINRDDDDLD